MLGLCGVVVMGLGGTHPSLNEINKLTDSRLSVSLFFVHQLKLERHMNIDSVLRVFI